MTAESSWASSPGRRRNMQANRRRDTEPELAVRRLLHAHGRRFRVDLYPEPALRRRADIVFTRQRVAVFIDGCFWHGCPEHGRRTFGANADYWPGKIAGNIARDSDTNGRLSDAGWRVMRFWEHERPDAVVSVIEQALDDAFMAAAATPSANGARPQQPRRLERSPSGRRREQTRGGDPRAGSAPPGQRSTRP
jgi:DNA mismatch endonuclease (patch repair protein)